LILTYSIRGTHTVLSRPRPLAATLQKRRQVVAALRPRLIQLTDTSLAQPSPSMVLQLHCATPTITISPLAARPRHYPHHLYGASGALPAPARGLGHLPRLLLVGVRDPRADGAVCHVRRQVRYDEDDEEEDDGEEWGHNEDVARMERYSEDARDQALLVKARVDDEVEVVLVFRVPRQTLTLLYVTTLCAAVTVAQVETHGSFCRRASRRA
jgi:hypothetical protein